MAFCINGSLADLVDFMAELGTQILEVDDDVLLDVSDYLPSRDIAAAQSGSDRHHDGDKAADVAFEHLMIPSGVGPG